MNDPNNRENTMNEDKNREDGDKNREGMTHDDAGTATRGRQMTAGTATQETTYNNAGLTTRQSGG
jgi:hypothetical protein